MYIQYSPFCHPGPPFSKDQWALQVACSLTIFLLVLLSDPRRQNETIQWNTVGMESSQLKSSFLLKSLLLGYRSFPTFDHKLLNP